MTDDELTRWLAENVTGWTIHACNAGSGRWAIPSGRMPFDMSGWRPTVFLDACRQLEEKVREMGLAEEYTYRLAATTCNPNELSDVWVRLLYSSARDRCLAIKRTVEERKGT